MLATGGAASRRADGFCSVFAGLCTMPVFGRFGRRFGGFSKYLKSLRWGSGHARDTWPLDPNVHFCTIFGPRFGPFVVRPRECSLFAFAYAFSFVVYPGGRDVRGTPGGRAGDGPPHDACKIHSKAPTPDHAAHAIAMPLGIRAMVPVSGECACVARVTFCRRSHHWHGFWGYVLRLSIPEIRASHLVKAIQQEPCHKAIWYFATPCRICTHFATLCHPRDKNGT